MDVITLNVGQGAFVITRHRSEAFVVDARIPPASDDSTEFVKGALAKFLKGYTVIGLILTGLDRDHADATGVGLVLRKYRPGWVMYPKYLKDSSEAKFVFDLITSEVKNRAGTSNPLHRWPIRLDKIENRTVRNLSSVVDFEFFSPHIEDMDSSNNSSLVTKITPKDARDFSYLITGDTENARWETINRLFSTALKADVMAAPHHGSDNAANRETMALVRPDTVLIEVTPVFWTGG